MIYRRVNGEFSLLKWWLPVRDLDLVKQFLILRLSVLLKSRLLDDKNGLYHYSKFGCSRWSSFDNKRYNTSHAYILAPKIFFLI